jgi:hypothetical protein
MWLLYKASRPGLRTAQAESLYLTGNHPPPHPYTHLSSCLLLDSLLSLLSCQPSAEACAAGTGGTQPELSGPPAQECSRTTAL